ncbi:restriction endonuclease [Pseudomonas sp. SG20056]|uniref:restriction endonuclease n=1 Tax=Pseudomonas sp. SG20056 TaxID=3074146 RepID=UPI00287F4479|nr:restriction endonuclease [Pseudomonas sp. SG20056]WNF48435.1 restriction endonuclease [Pseudomonas sp. SG20056]
MKILEPGQIYSRQKDINSVYGGSPQGGIVIPKESPYIFLFTRERRNLKDSAGFTDGDTFIYTGADQRGNVVMSGSNLAICDHQSNNRRILLFEVFSRDESKFLGECRYSKHVLTQHPDMQGNLRDTVDFHLKFIGKYDLEDSPPSCVALLRRAFSDELAKRIALDPDYLDQIEWRELEYVLQLTLEGIGFDSKITSAGKDGGKDIVLKCIFGEKQYTYFVEVKHWRSKKKVERSHLSNFLEVIIKEEVDGGLFLSSSGYSEQSISLLTEIERSTFRLGEKEKIFSLCKRYTKSRQGVMYPEGGIIDLLYEGTI